MNLFEAIETRRSVKHFDDSYVVPEADERKLLEAAMLSPTSFNIQNWRFVVVKDKAVREKIRAAAWNQAQVTEASLLIIVCADLKSWQKNPQHYWRNAPQEVQNMLVPMIGQFYNGREQIQRDEAMRSAGMAAQNIMLAARGVGLDSCPMIGFDADAVAQLIDLPEDHVIGMMITVGKAKKPANPRSGPVAYDDVVVTDSFKDSLKRKRA